VKVEFLRFLRPERKFESRDSLCRQIAADIAAARGA
jgi:FAD synthase